MYTDCTNEDEVKATYGFLTPPVTLARSAEGGDDHPPTPNEPDASVLLTPTPTPNEPDTSVLPTPTPTPNEPDASVLPTPTPTPNEPDASVLPTPTPTPNELGASVLTPTPSSNELDASVLLTPTPTPNEPNASVLLTPTSTSTSEKPDAQVLPTPTTEDLPSGNMLKNRNLATKKCHSRRMKRDRHDPLVDLTNRMQGPLKVTVTEIPQPKAKKPRKQKKKVEPPETIDDSKCSICSEKFQIGDKDKWTGCDFCNRWFHKRCVKGYNLKRKWKCHFKH